MESKLVEEDNINLLSPVEDDEVKKALFHMHSDKSPGPDDMSPAFYQRFLGIVGADIIQLVRDFFSNGTLSEQIKDANIVLIPKKKNPM